MRHVSRIVRIYKPDVLVTHSVGGEGGDGSGLMDADFDGEEAAVLEEGGRVRREAAVEVEAVRAT